MVNGKMKIISNNVVFMTKKQKIIYALLWLMMLALPFLGYLLESCTTSHSFTINADKIENPSIHYADSASVVNPF